mmetsp:Transcript_3033/g.9236  ORF Transcript_3033/g.9236 Transcript_3033/m.9236 type:complete len:278 (+) Transcript_3033:615-1448(+)
MLPSRTSRRRRQPTPRHPLFRSRGCRACSTPWRRQWTRFSPPNECARPCRRGFSRTSAPAASTTRAISRPPSEHDWSSRRSPRETVSRSVSGTRSPSTSAKESNSKPTAFIGRSTCYWATRRSKPRSSPPWRRRTAREARSTRSARSTAGASTSRAATTASPASSANSKNGPPSASATCPSPSTSVGPKRKSSTRPPRSRPPGASKPCWHAHKLPALTSSTSATKTTKRLPAKQPARTCSRTIPTPTCARSSTAAATRTSASPHPTTTQTSWPVSET